VPVLAITCTMLRHDLTPDFPHTPHPCMPQRFTPTTLPPTPLYLIAISFLTIQCLPRACRWASPQCMRRTEQPSTSTQTTPLTPANTQTPHPLAKYTTDSDSEPWLYPPPPLLFVCGAWTGTAQVGVSLVSLLDPLFERSRLHYLQLWFT